MATIQMSPNDASNNGKDWKFVINYNVKRPADGNDVQIGAGKFVHYFAPDYLPTIKKHIIFVIDVSGSMSGRKLEQTKDAMTTMLSKMSENKMDNFNIILFEWKVKVWKLDREKDLSYRYFLFKILPLDGTCIKISWNCVSSNSNDDLKLKITY